MEMLKGFKNFLMRGDVIVVAVGLVVALAFSNLVKAFTDSIINPLIASAQGGVKGPGLGWQLVSGGGDATYLNLGAFISAIIYFIIFMAVVYFLIVVPYKIVMARRGKTVFGEPPPNQDMPSVPVRRSESRRHQVQALWFRPRKSHHLTNLRRVTKSSRECPRMPSPLAVRSR
jgi:large conductance mechanosensitive channel